MRLVSCVFFCVLCARSIRQTNLLLLLAALIAGCSGTGAELNEAAVAIATNHGYGYGYDLISPDGVRFRNDPMLMQPLDQAAFDSIVVQAYRETETCTGISAPGPLIITVEMTQDEIDRGLQAVGTGRSFIDTGTIIVTPTAITDPYFYTGNPETGRLPGASTMRHEDVHYLLAASGFPNDLNVSHQSPLFTQCSGM